MLEAWYRILRSQAETASISAAHMFSKPLEHISETAAALAPRQCDKPEDSETKQQRGSGAALTFVRIMAAPSAMRLKASPRSRQPHTNGTLKLCLLMWCMSSAGVKTCRASQGHQRREGATPQAVSSQPL